MIQEVFSGGKPTKQQRTSMMVFLRKPKKGGCLKDFSLLRVSLLCSDMKLVTGIEATCLHSTATHSLSHLQLVAGDDRRIHHGICLARYAIQAANRRGGNGCGLLDLDFMAGFDWLQMDWVYEVLKKKKRNTDVIKCLANLYEENFTICVVNNIHGQPIPNLCGSLRQGDIPSMFFFAVGLDPLLYYLDRRLQGISVFSLPVAGPVQLVQESVQRPPSYQVQVQNACKTQTMAEHSESPVIQQTSTQGKWRNVLREPCGALHETQGTLQPLQEVYKLVAYTDDVKTSICSMQEFHLVINACSLLERASGVKLHCDPTAG